MAETVRVKNIGLRGVTVADTKISYINGEQGILIYRGYRIEELAEKSTYPETAYLLLHGRLPDRDELRRFEEELCEARELPAYVIQSFRHWPSTASPMDVLQASAPLLAMSDPDAGSTSRNDNVRTALRLIARVPVIIAAWHRIRQGREPVPAKRELSHSENFLWQLHGTPPDPQVARDLDICLILHADHTFNASTFACREVVSTRAHMYAGVSAGIGALSGSLHGGANARVMKMLLEVQSEPDPAAWVQHQLDAGERIMGIGHAVYKTTDPRAKILKEMSFRIGARTGQEQWARLSAQIEEAALAALERRGKSELKPNVDFYSASVYHMMGIPGDLMTPIFAMSRISGWCAHIIEEIFAEAQERPALYRPAAEYVGDYCGLTGCEYPSVEART